MTKRIFKGSTMLNPVSVVLVTSRNNEGKGNVFTDGWTSTATQIKIQYYSNLEGISE